MHVQGGHLSVWPCCSELFDTTAYWSKVAQARDDLEVVLPRRLTLWCADGTDALVLRRAWPHTHVFIHWSSSHCTYLTHACWHLPRSWLSKQKLILLDSCILEGSLRSVQLQKGTSCSALTPRCLFKLSLHAYSSAYIAAAYAEECLYCVQ